VYVIDRFLSQREERDESERQGDGGNSEKSDLELVLLRFSISMRSGTYLT
jgi:hypothetical protein